jgi:predicted RNA-binding protein YlxR (DUF448 family)
VDARGAVVSDAAERLPGRGMWVTADRDAIARAATRNAFARAAKRSVAVPPDLAAVTERAVARHALQLLERMNRNGLVTAAGGGAVFVIAHDAPADARATLAARTSDALCVDGLSVAETSFALGAQNVVHAALTPTSLCERFLRQAQRLRGLRGGSAVVSLPEASDRSAETTDAQEEVSGARTR